MKKTLGGARLGSGKKMEVQLKNFERSTHDLGYIWRSTMSVGTLVPFLSELALPGDTMDIELNCVVLTHPTLGPLFGSFKVQLDIFQAPIRLYQGVLHNNKLGIGLAMDTVLLPQVQMYAYPTADGTTDLDNSQINPSCIFSYLGIRGVGNTTVTEGTPRNFNALPYLSYWDIYKNYYANKQEEIGYVIHTPLVTIVETVGTVATVLGGDVTETPGAGSTPFTAMPGDQLVINYTVTPPIPDQIIINTAEHGDLTAEQLVTGYYDSGTALVSTSGSQWGNITLQSWRYRSVSDPATVKPQLYQFPLSNIDEMRDDIIATPITSAYTITSASQDPFGLPLATGSASIPNALSSQEGLAIKTYQSDLFNNWLRDEWVTTINSISAIDTSGGSFNIDTLILANKVYNMLNQIAVSGGSYDDWLDAVYNEERYKRCSTPMYMGGLSKELVFQEVVSNSTSGDQPLGTLAGRGNMGHKHKGGKIRIKVDEPSYIIGLVSLTPRIDYSQGNKWDTHLITMDDLHKPHLDEIGFQDLIVEQMHFYSTEWDVGTSKWVQSAAGKQPAWINYMTNVNQVRGNFAIATNEMFMVLNRRYEINDGAISDLTTYIDPSKFNFIFAETSLDAQNYWVQIAIDNIARRKMSAKVMPNL